MSESDLVKIINFWKEVAEKSDLFPREIVDKIKIKTSEIIDIVGPRRSGKSSVLKLIIKKVASSDNYLYINFEDPYFLDHKSPAILEDLVETYKTYFSSNLQYLFFDEIQNINSWEKAVRKLQETNKYKIFVTGSSAKLLSSEFATLLTGRHTSYKLYPLSLKEYLIFKKSFPKNKKDLIVNEKIINKHFEEYQKIGGFPKIVLTKNIELLKQYYFDIIEKDIISRYDVREKNILQNMGVYLLTNSAKTLSITSLENIYDISFSLAETYIGYFKEAFLVFELPQFSYSLKTQEKAFKKIYAVDTGLAHAVSFQFSEDKGKTLENCVFLHLINQNLNLYYYKTENNKEVDFLVKKNNHAELIQVCASLDDEKTAKREIDSLKEAMDELNLKEGTILTQGKEKTLTLQKSKIYIKSLPSWFLS